MTSREGPVLCTWALSVRCRRRRRRRHLLPAQPRQHRHHAAEQLERQPISVIIDSAQNAHHVDHCSAFHGGSSRDREVPCAVRIGSSSSSFRDVERNRDRCPAQLFSKLSLSAGNRFTYRCGNGHKLDRAHPAFENSACSHIGVWRPRLRRRRRRRQRSRLRQSMLNSLAKPPECSKN